MGNSFIERKMQEENWPLGDEYIKFEKGPFRDIKFIQTVAVPEDCILIHPFVISQILNAQQAEDGYITIVKRKE